MSLKFAIQFTLYLNFFSTYYEHSTFLNISHVSSHNIFTKSLSGKLYFDTHFVNNLKPIEIKYHAWSHS